MSYKMNPLHRFLFLISVLFMFSSCEEDNKEPEVKTRTILVYIAGDNSLSSFVEDDLKEMSDGLKTIDTENNNLIVFFDKGSQAELIHFVKDKKGNVVRKIVKDYKTRNSTDAESMKEVFKTTFSQFPALSYGITFWSHGEGWLPSPNSTKTRWWGQDEGSGSYMDIADLHKALKSAPHLDFILFDACFMQSIEVAYELRDCANYFIGSATEMPGPGAPYKEVVNAFFSNQKDDELAKDIAQAYYEPYHLTYDENKKSTNDCWTAGVSIGVINSAALEPLAQATKKVISTTAIDIKTINTNGVLYYGRGQRYYYYLDFNGIMEKVIPDKNALYEEWHTAFQNTMIQYQTTPKNYSVSEELFSMEGSCGVSIYIPQGIHTNLDLFHQTFAWDSASGI